MSALDLVNTNVAVYGSLRYGKGNHRILDNEYTQYLGTARVQGFDMYSMGAFPFIVQGDGEITVEVYKVTDHLTAGRLDMLEGYPSFYDRKQIQTPHGKAWVYFMHKQQTSSYEKVHSGDWCEFHSG